MTVRASGKGCLEFSADKCDDVNFGSWWFLPFLWARRIDSATLTSSLMTSARFFYSTRIRSSRGGTPQFWPVQIYRTQTRPTEGFSRSWLQTIRGNRHQPITVLADSPTTQRSILRLPCDSLCSSLRLSEQDQPLLPRHDRAEFLIRLRLDLRRWWSCSTHRDFQ